MKTAQSITGKSLDQAGFRLHETHQSIDIHRVFDVLHGNLAAYRIRNFLSPEACQNIVKNFWNSPQKVPRLGYGEDGVEGYFLGASHIEKNTQEYLTEARAVETAVQCLYAGTINPLAAFREALVSKDHAYTRVRPAEHDGLLAGDSKAVYWNNIGDFLLSPHDDFAQLRDPRQQGFEIQQASRVMAVNFYAEVSSNAGQLRIWNVEPDDLSRAKLDLTYSGFPYPAEVLNDFENIDISVATGDLCVINGNLVHAVMRGDTSALAKNRLLVTCFMTFNDNNELVWWT